MRKSLLEQRDPCADFSGVPPGAVLLLEQDQFSRRREAYFPSRVVQKHEGKQSMGFGALREQIHQHLAETDRFVAQLASDQRITGRGNITLIRRSGR